MKLADKKTIWQKTNGRCHFCGAKLSFNRKSTSHGKLYIDHIFPKARGGENDLANYLPICGPCNRLRWHRKSRTLRKIFLYGIIGYNEAKKKSKLGERLRTLFTRRNKQNKNRRRS